MKYFFSSDYHLGHYNIIRYCGRPFKSLEEMNRTIMKNHNERIKNEDYFFFLGDFSFHNTKGGKTGEGIPVKAKEYEKLLNGRKIFIKGNHDRNNKCKTIIQNIVIKYGQYRINLVHDPKYVKYNYKFNLVGHIHEKWKFKKFIKTDSKGRYLASTIAINVGVDVNNFRPVTLEEIMKEYNLWKKGKIDFKGNKK